MLGSTLIELNESVRNLLSYNISFLLLFDQTNSVRMSKLIAFLFLQAMAVAPITCLPTSDIANNFLVPRGGACFVSILKKGAARAYT